MFLSSRISLLFLSVCLISLPLSAQNALSDSVAVMYQRYFQLEARHIALQDSLMRVSGQVNQVSLQSQALPSLEDSVRAANSRYRQVNQQVQSLNNTLSGSLQQVNRLTQNDLLSKESRLQNRKLQIIQTAKFLKAANNSYDAIAAALATSDYLNDVGSLNSPTNTDLGFSLKDDIGELLDQQIIKNNGKFNGKDPSKFKAIVDALIESPITTAVTSAVPALSSIRAVVDLVSSVIVREKDVSVDDFQAFKQSLSKYLNHYEELAQASYDFNGNLDNLKIKTEALRTVMQGFAVERVNALVPQAIPPDQDDYPINDIIFIHYQWDQLEPKINDIIAGYTSSRGQVNYEQALSDPRMEYPLYVITQAQFISQELESITNEYVSAYQLYHDRLLQILARSKSLSKDTAKVDAKRKELDEKLSLLIQTFRNNVKIREVNQAMLQIPAY
ncbi:MAG: hypothetical protein AAF399_22355 [Bacteroidota bacterium]